jgi:hypothetical protein
MTLKLEMMQLAGSLLLNTFALLTLQVMAIVFIERFLYAFMGTNSITFTSVN